MKMLTTAATIAAVLVSAGTAMAAPPVGTPSTPPPAAAGHRGQYASNQNLRVARRHVERAIDRLQHDAEDYGGHRVKAIDDLTQARQYLDQALDYRAGGGNRRVPSAGAPGGRPVPVTNPGGRPITAPVAGSDETANGESTNEFERGQESSNDNLQRVRAHVEAAIDALNSDASDYGGFKERAIDRLQAARAELEAAIDFVHQPGVRNGGSGQHVSDANLRFVQEHVQTAITRLESDRHDYGGHRVAAINDLHNSNNYITSALQYDTTHENTSTVPSAGGVLPVGGGAVMKPAIGQAASNDSLADARNHIETAIDALSRDRHDYGGFREKAIDALQSARSELLAALKYR